MKRQDPELRLVLVGDGPAAHRCDSATPRGVFAGMRHRRRSCRALRLRRSVLVPEHHGDLWQRYVGGDGERPGVVALTTMLPRASISCMARAGCWPPSEMRSAFERIGGELVRRMLRADPYAGRQREVRGRAHRLGERERRVCRCAGALRGTSARGSIAATIDTSISARCTVRIRSCGPDIRLNHRPKPPGGVMSAYLISTIEITDPAGYEEYRKLVAPALQQVRRQVPRSRRQDRLPGRAVEAQTRRGGRVREHGKGARVQRFSRLCQGEGHPPEDFDQQRARRRGRLSLIAQCWLNCEALNVRREIMCYTCNLSR